MKKQEKQEEQEKPEEQEAPETLESPQESPREGPKEVKGMKELVEYIAKAIVNAPDNVVVTEEIDDQGTILKLQVADEDKGRVIGKQGRVAQAMRTLIRVMAAKAGTRASLEII
jgi:predicted RNA-binding protein YlqC (UPF0109 family)